MKSKILKIVTVILLLVTLTLANFIYVGAGLLSYAASDITTNHQNVEFDAQLKEGNILLLQINVKKEGYFNGEIALENSNFKLKSVKDDAYINKVEENKITLNQLNAGTSAKIEIEIEPVRDEIFNTGLLNVVSKLNLSGIYRDSTEKDIKIKASREVEYEYIENNKEEDVQNSAEIITNKIMKVSGEDKRVIQVEMDLGLKENNYPIKEIDVKMDVPSINKKQPTIAKKIDFNNMTHWDYKYENSAVEVNFTNEPNEQNYILWRKQGSEKIVLTLIYEKDANAEELENLQPSVKVTLYNGKEIATIAKIDKKQLTEEKDSLIQTTVSNSESSIYKGKLYSGIDRSYESRTNIAVNLANAENSIKIKENSTNYIVDGKEINANVVYNKTIINKDNFDKILGQSGKLTIANENGEIIATVDNSTQIDENKNIVIDYTGKEPKEIEIKTTAPIVEGNLLLTHTKTIKEEQNKELVKQETELCTYVEYEYNTGVTNKAEAKIALEESKTEASLEVNKETLSTVVENNVEIRAKLQANSEQYNLYNNPKITLELPEEVENIEINSIDLIYENELKVKNYNVVDGRKIEIELEGKQTSYKDLSTEAAVVVINANVSVSKKAATKDSQIIMAYSNNEETGTDSKAIRIVAPKDMTVINSIKELNIETIGQEESKEVTIQRGTSAKQLETQIEVINNDENDIENVKITGNFPTKSQENNMDIKVTQGINLQGIEGVEVYYTENENATEDLQNTTNGWTNEITNASKVRKYLITIPSMKTKASLQATYKIEIPALLEYNQTAKQGYSVKYTNTLTKTESEMKSTTIILQTGVGPKLETKIEPILNGTKLEEKSVVKNGEVIKYKIEVSNIGSEEIKDVLVQANVPEGTTLVKPQVNYEYTGASYYKELADKTFEDKIETIKVGEVATREYEVRVNTGVEAGTKLSNTSQVKYGDVIKTANAPQLVTEKGNIRVTAKRVTDRNINLYESGTVQYFVIIENISGQRQDNVTVKTNLPEALKVSRLMLITGMESQEISDEDIYRTESIAETEVREIQESELTSNNSIEGTKSEELEYKNELNIGSLEAGETKVLSYDMSIDKLEQAESLNFSVVVNDENDEYKSNTVTDNIRKVDISLNMTTNTESKYVKTGDIIEYVITVENNGTETVEGLKIKDEIPNSLTVNKVSFDEEEISELNGNNNLEISCNIKAGTESTIKIETTVNYSAGRDNAEPITNIAYAELLGEKVATTQEINHIIEANSTENPGEGENEKDNDVKDNDIATGNKMITGLAWFDANSNGKKDNDEKTLNNIKVHLLNTETNNLVKDEKGNVLEAATNDNGLYVLNNIGNGKYIAIFEYDSNQYSLTKYKVENVDESSNSDVMKNELLIEGKKQVVASTDILEINGENISDINIGLIELKDFEFKLDKFVSKILIQNETGTTVKEYTDATVAKAELDGKKINGTTVIVEYKIRVTNTGEVPGYVKKIADYVPNDLKFSSELNKDWYQTGDTLYNASLANEQILAGESREVILTLTKAMTENNTGLINNTAEIAESYNEAGLADSKSTPGNKVNGENDYGSADVILSLKTGGAIYWTIGIIIVIALGITTFIILRKKSNNGDKK